MAKSVVPSVVATQNRTIQFPEEGRACLESGPVPEVRPGQILCRTIYSGISNGTERNHLTGGNYGRRFPAGIGYQKVAEVAAVGEGVERYRVGDRVFSGAVGKHCAWFVEDAGHPDGERHLVIHLQPTLRPTEAALLGVGGVAMHNVRRARVGSGERVLVIGAGLIGLFAAQCAAAAGAHVTIANRSAGRLEVARELGAHATVELSSGEKWADLRRQGPFDVVFETTGGDVLDQIIGRSDGPPRGLVRHGGRLALVGGRFEVSFESNSAQFQSLQILLSAHFRREDLLELVRLVEAGRVQIGPLVRDVVPVEQAEAIYTRLYREAGSLLGTVLDWTGDTDGA